MLLNLKRVTSPEIFRQLLLSLQSITCIHTLHSMLGCLDHFKNTLHGYLGLFSISALLLTPFLCLCQLWRAQRGHLCNLQTQQRQQWQINASSLSLFTAYFSSKGDILQQSYQASFKSSNAIFTQELPLCVPYTWHVVPIPISPWPYPYPSPADPFSTEPMKAFLVFLTPKPLPLRCKQKEQRRLRPFLKAELERL